MPIATAISNLQLTPLLLAIEALPRVNGWKRLEGRTREKDFERSLRAEIHDPLWMLSRQWQVGEFQGEDAGTAVEARFVLESSQLTHFQNANLSEPIAYNDQVPLEVRVEREDLDFDIFTKVQIGKTWLQLLKNQSLEVHSVHYLTKYPLMPPSVITESDALDSDLAAHQYFLFAEKRIPDGEKLLKSIDNLSHESDLAGNADVLKLVALGEQLARQYKKIYSQPETQPDTQKDDSWKQTQLEYQFTLTIPESAGQNVVLNADQYYQGHLDWYNFDIKAHSTDRTAVAPQREVHAYIPTPIQFQGMPNRRWWAFEDGETDLGQLNLQTTDIATLLFAEFALVFSNDWQLLPCELPVGSLNRIEGVLVTDTFGIKTWLPPIGRGQDDAWNQWRMFTLNTEGVGGAADTRLFLPPTLVKTLASKPIEEVRFIRDEMANMVWAIEHHVASPLSLPMDGYEKSQELVEYLQKTGKIPTPQLPPQPKDGDPPAPPLRYVLGTQVPRNWIPFIPVKKIGSLSQIRLQKAAMPEYLDRLGYGDIVLSQTDLLKGEPFYINEEEVPRAGAIVKKTFQRTRWYNGKTFVWLGKQKTVGRGEGSSGLMFDQII